MDMICICVMLPDFQKFQWCQLAAAHHVPHIPQNPGILPKTICSGQWLFYWTDQLRVASIWSNMYIATWQCNGVRGVLSTRMELVCLPVVLENSQDLYSSFWLIRIWSPWRVIPSQHYLFIFGACLLTIILYITTYNSLFDTRMSLYHTNHSQNDLYRQVNWLQKTRHWPDTVLPDVPYIFVPDVAQKGYSNGFVVPVKESQAQATRTCRKG